MKKIAISFLLFFSVIVSSYSFTSYRDSLMNIDVLKGAEAMQLLDLLEKVENESGDGQMSLYCSKALTLYGWFLVQSEEWSIAGDVFEAALDYCPTDSVGMRHFIKSGLGGMYVYAGDYEKAERNLLEAAEYHKKKGHETELLTDYFNLGTLYKHWDNKAKSLHYYNKALEMSQKKEHDLYHCLLLDYMSGLETDDKVRLDMLQRSIDIAFKNNFFKQQASNLLALAQYYYRQTEYEKAKVALDKALKSAERYGIDKVRIGCYELLSKIYSSQKDYGMAYNCIREVAESRTELYAAENKSLYLHNNYASQLLQWCDKATAGAGSAAVLPWWQIMVAVLVTAALCCLGCYWIWRMRRPLKCGDDVEETAPASANMPPAVAPVSDEETRNMTAILNQLLMFYNSYNELLDKIRQMIRQSYRSGDAEQNAQLKKISNFITQNMLQDKRGIYTERLEEDNRNFLARLEALHPGIAESEKKLAVYLRMDFSSRDIALLTGNQLKSVNMSRYRLRKTLRLSSEDDLVDYLHKI